MVTITDEQLLNHEEHEIKFIVDDNEEAFLVFCFDCESILDQVWIDEMDKER